MFTLNIDGAYSVTGTNDANAYWNSKDWAAGKVPTDDPSIKNGFKGIEMDTATVYFFDEEDKVWYPFT